MHAPGHPNRGSGMPVQGGQELQQRPGPQAGPRQSPCFGQCSLQNWRAAATVGAHQVGRRPAAGTHRLGRRAAGMRRAAQQALGTRREGWRAAGMSSTELAAGGSCQAEAQAADAGRTGR